MNSDNQLYEQLREADPAAQLDRNPSSERGRRLKQRAIHEAAETRDHTRVPRKRAVTLIAAVIMMLGSVAVAAGVFEPDPENVSSILDEAEDGDRYSVHTEGWRPNLRSEQVWCAYDSGVVGSTRTFDFDLDQPMTEDHLIDACTQGPDQHRAAHGDVPDDFTVCEAYAPTGEIQRAIDTPARGWQNVTGDLSAERPGFPVVLGWDAPDCGDVSLDTNSPPLELRSWTSMDGVNTARELEIALTAAALNGCLSEADALALANEARDRLHGEWLLVEHRASIECHRVWLDPQMGILEIGGRQ